MALREDNGPYCLIWIGVLLMGAYYANFAYMIWTSPSASASFFAVSNFFFMLLLMILPPLMVILFTGYLRPSRGKAKMAMLGPSVMAGLFFVIIANVVSLNTDILGNLIMFSAWGIGSSLLTAGGFSIIQSFDQGTSSGMLDVSSLYYGPPKEESEPEPVVEDVEEPSKEPEADSEEEKPEEPVSE